MTEKDLIGKTITSATVMKREGLDDEGWLKLEFTDGTACVIKAYYDASYTGQSADEYPTRISISDDVSGLVPSETE